MAFLYLFPADVKKNLELGLKGLIIQTVFKIGLSDNSLDNSFGNNDIFQIIDNKFH